MDISQFLNLTIPLQTCSSCNITFPPNPSLSVTKIHEYISSHPGNHIAAGVDSPSLSQHLHTARAELDSYDNEIAKLHDVLSELKARRDTLSRAITQMDGMVKQSIRRLPVEILLNIFRLCCDGMDIAEASTPPGTGGWSSMHPALTLSLVCSRWRTIVHNAPHLWSKILISIINPQHIISVSNMIHRLTQFCLDRSQTQPLYISFGRCYPGNLSLAFGELVKHSARWKDVQLFYLPQCGEFPVHLPVLESLVIGGYSSGTGGFPEKVYSPRLRSLQVTHDAVSLSRRFELKSVTKLVLRDTVHGSGVFPVLRECPVLRTLELDGVSFDRLDQVQPGGGVGQAGDAGAGPLELPGLEELTILNPGFLFPFNVFFNHITLPSLSKLTISVTHTVGGSHRVFFDARTSAAFNQFVLRSGKPPLVELRFGHINFYDIQDLVDILEMYSETLRRLSLVMCSHYSKRWDDVLERMTLGRGLGSVRSGGLNIDEGLHEDLAIEGGSKVDSSFLPNLKFLEIEFHRWSERSERLLVDMVESRWTCESGKRLAVLTVVCGEGDKGAIKSALKRMKDEGMEVRVERS
ncbi:hypothetical protein PM082_002058 [Marasmius tenuissimus]|nr:hypothetical protein PM082_002058 [Marasmius tenuissimus]